MLVASDKGDKGLRGSRKRTDTWRLMNSGGLNRFGLLPVGWLKKLCLWVNEDGSMSFSGGLSGSFIYGPPIFFSFLCFF